jgi:CRP-like cAMP-binding protein
MKVATKFFQKNAFIYLEGKNSSKYFYIVKSGQIFIKKSNQILGNLEEVKGTGYIFGIIQCITGISDEETVQAISDCEIFVIAKDKIDELYLEHPKVILKILSEYSEILRTLDKDLLQYDFFSPHFNRSEKIFEIANKYISLKQLHKAAHLLKVSLNEFQNKSDITAKINQILAKLPPVEIVSTSQSVTEKSYPAQSVVFTEYELGNNFFIIKSGRIKISKLRHDREVVLAILDEGDIFGEMAMLNDKPRNATATAMTDSEIMIVDKKSVDKLPPPLFVKILFFLTQRIWMVEQQLICFKLPIPTSKIYYLLTAKVKQLVQDQKKEYEKNLTFKFPVDELYQLLGFTEKNKKDIDDFLHDKNFEFYKDSIKIRNIGDLFDRNSYHFSKALHSYGGSISKKLNL